MLRRNPAFAEGVGFLPEDIFQLHIGPELQLRHEDDHGLRVRVLRGGPVYAFDHGPGGRRLQHEADTQRRMGLAGGRQRAGAPAERGDVQAVDERAFLKDPMLDPVEHGMDRPAGKAHGSISFRSGSVPSGRARTASQVMTARIASSRPMAIIEESTAPVMPEARTMGEARKNTAAADRP